MDAHMQTFLQQFQHLKIQLEEITSATNNFHNENYIGGGGFGKVYKGEVSHFMGKSMVAIKRLDRRHGQGTPEFLKEVTTLSRYRHENLISLLGYCYEGDEMILVYEHASRGSLDRHLNSPHLTWSQRLKICLDAAKGLSYLHDPMETHQRLIHCDIKSANILLDTRWNAKVSDFGLSIMGPANEQQSVIVTFAAGTPGYCDPQYAMTHTLTKESDVYSFGVVLFEVLCGTLCCAYSNGHVQQILVPTWVESCKQKKLNEIIFKNPTSEPLDQCSLEIFSDIAYRCLKQSREDRPTLAEVVTELEAALESQELLESREIKWKAQLFYYDEITKTAEPPLNDRSKVELRELLTKGALLNGGKSWFSLNKKGEHCEMISFAECVDSDPSESESSQCCFSFGKKGKHCEMISIAEGPSNSRFAAGTYYYKKGSVKTRVKAQFLSPGITYTVNLVLRITVPDYSRKCYHIHLKYRLHGETETSISYLAYKREDGWLMCELYQFTSDERVVDFQILFDGFRHYTSIEVEGIEFWPLEKVEHTNKKLPISDSNENWEGKLPNDYEDIMKWSKNNVQWTTKKEAYSIIRRGFLINDGEEWFSLDKNGKKCHMLSVVHIWGVDERAFLVPDSRFGKAVQWNIWSLSISVKIQSQLLSSQTTYASYLVYKLREVQYAGFEAPLEVKDKEHSGSDDIWYIYLVSPQTQVIRPKAGQNTSNPLHRTKIKGIPQQRNDGWMEVQIWEFRTATTTQMTPMRIRLASSSGFELKSVIIQGIEFRPV